MQIQRRIYWVFRYHLNTNNIWLEKICRIRIYRSQLFEYLVFTLVYLVLSIQYYTITEIFAHL